MKMKNLLYACVLMLCCNVFAQETYAPQQIVTGTFIGQSERLDSMPIYDANEFNNGVPVMILDQKFEGSSNVPVNNVPTVIHNLQTEPGKIVTMPIEQNFVGAGQNESGFLPPDPTGAVGPNHYVHSVNSIIKIFSKSGNLLLGPVNLSTF